MKSIKLFLIILITVVFSACNEQKKSNEVATNNGESKIEVIDFYGTHRCVKCKGIESHAKYTVETYFADEPKVTFKTVNVDNDENYAIAEKFEASGTALYLNVVKDGKENHIDLTEFGFSNVNDQETFVAELKEKIKEELTKL